MNKYMKNLQIRIYISLTEFEHIPVEHIIIREPLPMKESPEQLPKVTIVRPLFKP